MHLYVYEMTHHQAYVDAHNMLLTVLAETGVSGVVLFGWFVTWIIWRAFLAARSAQDRFLRASAVGLAAGLVGFLVMSTSFDAQRQRVFWMASALVFAIWRTSTASPQDRGAELR
jgi:O-antigen ligase